MCASPKPAPLFLFLVFLGLFFFPAFPSAKAEPSEDVPTRLAAIESRLKNIEARQQEIIEREDRILAELDRIRIWVHRR